MGDLIAFLNARLDEDEETARAAYCEGPSAQQPTAPPKGSWWTTSRIMTGLGLGTWLDAQHIVRFDPARMLREVEAKRAIINDAAKEATALDMQVDGEWGVHDRDYAADPLLGDALLRILAAVYSDHPDYREEWKPAIMEPR